MKQYIRRLASALSVAVLFAPFFHFGVAHADPVITEYQVPAALNAFGNVTTLTKGSDGNLWTTGRNTANTQTTSVIQMTPSGTFNSFPIPGNIVPLGANEGPDGNLWITNITHNTVYKVDTSGNVNIYGVNTFGGPEGITAGPDGNMWIAFNGGGPSGVGYMTTDGAFTPVAPIGSDHPTGITAGPDGRLWFLRYARDCSAEDVDALTTDGTLTRYSVPANPSGCGFTEAEDGLTFGPDGRLWFTDGGNNAIDAMTTDGTLTQYSLPTASTFPAGIVSAGGNLWFTESGTNKIGEITTAGAITEFPLGSGATNPSYLVADSDGSLWFTNRSSNGAQIGHFVPSATPTSPTNLSAQSPTNSAPTLSWSAASGATSYNVYRNGVLLDTIGANNTTYTDNLASEGNNSYDVTAVNSSGESGASNTITVLVDRTAPTIIYHVTPVADSSGNNTGNVTVTFTCTDNTGGSGIASCTDPATVSDEGVGHTIDGTALDAAGNSTTIHANASLLVKAINAGGSTAGNYDADADYSGGQVYSSSAMVTASNVTVMAAPQEVYQTVRYGNTMSYAIPDLTPGASYTLRLHFNELYWDTALAGGQGGVGSRVFNVAVNGQSALTNFDVYKEAGGANKAIVEEIPVTADVNGNATVQFSTVTDNAMVSGIELYQGTLPPEPPAGTLETATSAYINAGGSSVGNFAADTDFNGGTPYTSSTAVDTTQATNPAPQSVYQSVRYGNFTYAVPNLTPNTKFLVRLHFNELYWGTALAGGQGGVGSRVFNVSINGTNALSNFDIYKEAGGANKALVEDFVVPSDANGNITIQFSTVTDNAMVSGIEILKPTVPTPTYFTANDGTNFSRSTDPFTSGVATEAVNTDGSIEVRSNNPSGYADSGFVLYQGTLGNLPNFTTTGSGVLMV